jgi:hypothetical protein
LAIIRVGQPVERLTKESAANLSAEALARLNAARQDMDCLGTAVPILISRKLQQTTPAWECARF